MTIPGNFTISKKKSPPNWNFGSKLGLNSVELYVHKDIVA